MSTTTTSSSPPGRTAQAINAWLHREPLASISYCLFWTVFLSLCIPIAIFFLPIQMIVRLVTWYQGRNAYAPKRHEEEEMAVVVTGCDSGFGKEIALWAANAGFMVFAGCLSKDSFQAFVGDDNIQPVVMDVTSDKDVANVATQVKQWLQDKSATKKRVLHGLVNNAGIHAGMHVDLTDLSVYQKVMDVNFFGMVRCCKAFLPTLQDQAIKKTHTGARIINIVSVAGLFPPMEAGSVYGASKHAAQAFTAGLRLELKSFDIQVSAVCPSYHATPILDGLGDKITMFWEGLPQEKRDIYGEAFFQTILTGALESIPKHTWKMDVVVEFVVRSLISRRIPAQSAIGSDFRFMIMGLNMVPPGILDVPTLTPAAMEQK